MLVAILYCSDSFARLISDQSRFDSEHWPHRRKLCMQYLVVLEIRWLNTWWYVDDEMVICWWWDGGSWVVERRKSFPVHETGKLYVKLCNWRNNSCAATSLMLGSFLWVLPRFSPTDLVYAERSWYGACRSRSGTFLNSFERKFENRNRDKEGFPWHSEWPTEQCKELSLAFPWAVCWEASLAFPWLQSLVCQVIIVVRWEESTRALSVSVCWVSP